VQYTISTDIVDRDRLAVWMDSLGIERGPILGGVRLAGGTQNVLWRFQRGPRAFVLRRGPMHLRADSNRTIAREARVLKTLAGTDVPHANFVAVSEDPSILGAAFYLMEAVDGFNATLNPSDEMRLDRKVRHTMGLSLIEAQTKLARFDPMAAGLDDFGKLDGFLERQVGRWAAQLDSYAQYPQWSGRDDLPPVAAIGQWLDENRPKRCQPGLIHGDYHIGNVIYAGAGAVVAIVDWEMATLGDPLVDLGRVLSTWPDEDGTVPMSMRVEPWDGFPSRSDLISHYARLSGRDLTDLRWFEILSCYKLAIILEGTYARAQAGQSDAATGRRLHASAIALLHRALGWLEKC
jgi:aminoglycoside phosphotransferase (APT) family kinase protein